MSNYSNGSLLEIKSPKNLYKKIPFNIKKTKLYIKIYKNIYRNNKLLFVVLFGKFKQLITSF